MLLMTCSLDALILIIRVLINIPQQNPVDTVPTDIWTIVYRLIIQAYMQKINMG